MSLNRRRKFLYKKAQETATPAAMFVFFILVFIILYVLFLPPEDREDLLNLSDDDEGDETDEPDTNEDNLLLEEQPGSLFFSEENFFKHSLPDVYLIKKTEGELLGGWNSVYVKSALFNKKLGSLDFRVEDASEIGDAELTFDIDKAEGIIQIFLNDFLVYEGDLQRGTINPIHIDKGNIHSSNTLVLKALSPGLAFWKSNEFIIRNIKLYGERTKETLSGEMNFFVYPEELSSPKKAIFRFYVECNQQEMRRLSARINSQLVFDSIPSCGSVNQVEFSPSILREENNIITVSAGSSAYVRESSIRIETSDPIYPTYYFNIKEEDYDDIVNGLKKAMLYLSFVTEENKAEVDINGNLLYLESDDYIYRDISELVKRTGNYISLIPKKDIKVNLLKVYLEKDD